MIHENATAKNSGGGGDSPYEETAGTGKEFGAE